MRFPLKISFPTGIPFLRVVIGEGYVHQTGSSPHCARGRSLVGALLSPWL